MSPELLALLVVSVTIAGMKLYLARRLHEVRRDIADLRERMARPEGPFEGFTRADRAAAAA